MSNVKDLGITDPQGELSIEDTTFSEPIKFPDTPTFKVLSFQKNPSGGTDDSFKPYSIQRLSDGMEFTIGERVENDMGMMGKILDWTLLETDVFATTTWSSVGMWIDELKKMVELPTKYQRGDRVKINYKQFNVPLGYIRKVHLDGSSVQYDIEVLVHAEGKNRTVRIYNVEESLLEEFV
jgi:hypothetical protein